MTIDLAGLPGGGSCTWMPWNETNPVNERLKFAVDAQRGRSSMTELCEQYGISRKTGYKLLRRYQEDGPEGLRDRSRAPRSHPNRTPDSTEAAILRMRKAHSTWGSKKLLTVLERERPDLELPARSTVDAILKRAGLVAPRAKRSRRKGRPAPPIVPAHMPNDVWSIDYKGWFKVGDGTRCDPLTVNDVFSRMSLECRALVAPKSPDVKDRLLELFYTYGLPSYMLSDNGPPFGSRGIGGLSRLSVWLMRLGIQPIFIQPGRPDQNGRHERFHETLKAETARPPRSSIRAQQRAFDRFQQCYNEERPHEALDMRTPADVYVPSARTQVDDDSEHEYPGEFEVRKVRSDGTIKWMNKLVFIGEALSGETVGLQIIDDERCEVFLGVMKLGVLSERLRTVIPIHEPA